MSKRLGDFTLKEFIKVLNDCTSEKIRHCKHCLFKDIECNSGQLSNFNLSELDLNQEVEVDVE